jgi:hypothetical protein
MRNDASDIELARYQEQPITLAVMMNVLDAGLRQNTRERSRILRLGRQSRTRRGLELHLCNDRSGVRAGDHDHNTNSDEHTAS